MKSNLKLFMDEIAPIPDEDFDTISNFFDFYEYPKNYFILKQGAVCKNLWFLTKGAVRYFYTDNEGKDSNVWFSLDQDIVADASSFINQSASFESIQLIEDSLFYAIEYNNLQKLLQTNHTFAIWYIKLVEKYYVHQIEDRIGDLQFLTAKQRYEKLLAQFPSISQRISLGHIASYLNITQETLSRIRAGKI